MVENEIAHIKSCYDLLYLQLTCPANMNEVAWGRRKLDAMDVIDKETIATIEASVYVRIRLSNNGKTIHKSRKENPQKLTQLSSRSHPRHLVGKRAAKKDTIIDITSDSQVNSNFPYRWSPAGLTFNNYFYLFLCPRVFEE